MSLLNHPKGLGILFFTEMWERFSFYGMRALLILYLVNALGLDRANALEIYATYTALVYLTPILGGYLADRWLGTQRAIVIGGIVMAMGHFAMAFPSMLYTALGLIIVGNGFFKPNISSMVGMLYKNSDTRRDGGFTLFYMGINLGAFISPLICGTLGEKLGWHWGFSAAGIGMIIGLITFIIGQKRMTIDTLSHSSQHASTIQHKLGWKDGKLIALISLICLIMVILITTAWPWFRPWWSGLSSIQKMLIPSLILIGIAFSSRIKHRFTANRTVENLQPNLTRIELQRMLVIFILGLFVIFFWMGFEQAGGTMSLFADKQTDRLIFDWEIPTSYFQSINPLVIILLAPVFSVFWYRLDQSTYALSSVAKQAIGMIILGSGFIVLAIAQQRADILGQVSPLWLVAVFVLHTLGELCLSPIGLSMVTKLAPTQFLSLMMGIWFTGIAIASYLAGILESLLTSSGIPLYWFLVGSSMGAGLLLLLLTPLIHRLMHGVR